MAATKLTWEDDLENLDNGIYRLHILGENGKLYQKKLFKNR